MRNQTYGNRAKHVLARINNLSFCWFIRPVLLISAGLLGLLASGYFGQRTILLHIAIELLPIPIFFSLWLRALGPQESRVCATRPFFSFPCGILSAGCFIAANMAPSQWREPLAICAVISGLAAFVNIPACWIRILCDPRLAIVACIGGFSATVYTYLQKYLWKYLCHTIAQAIYGLLHLATNIPITLVYKDFNDVDYDMFTRHVRTRFYVHRYASDPSHTILTSIKKETMPEIQNGADIVSLHTDHFSVDLFAACSGMEGICIFFFLLAFLVLVDWSYFKKIPLTSLFLCACVYMFIMNMLRIIALFILGYWAYAPDAGHYARMAQGWPIALFHTWIGMLTYLMAYIIFVGCLYALIARRKPSRL